MIDLEDSGIEPGLTSPEIAGDAQSVLDRITSNRDGQEDVLTIEWPSWGGSISGKFKILDKQVIEGMVRRVRKASSAGEGAASSEGMAADADFLIKACIGVVGYDSEQDREIPLADGLTMDFARMLKPVYPQGHPMAGQPFEITSTRELVIYLTKWNGIALATFAAKIARWMQDTSKPVEDPQ